jgi:hypothetical protein
MHLLVVLQEQQELRQVQEVALLVLLQQELPALVEE